MKSMMFKLAVLLLIVVLLSACGGQGAETPASVPTEEAAPVTETPVVIPTATDTSVPATDPATEAPANTESAPAGATVSFVNDVMPIIQSRCINCHGGDRIEEGLSMNSHAELMVGSENGAVITPGDAANSLLVEMVAEGEMPKRGPKLTPPQVQLIADWINQGALDN